MFEKCIPFNSVVFIDREIIQNEYEYYFGNKKDEKIVTFCYYNVKTDKVTDIGLMTYKDALNFALYRRKDGRYKNFEYYIYLK